jgi:hypothetical protein
MNSGNQSRVDPSGPFKGICKYTPLRIRYWGIVCTPCSDKQTVKKGGVGPE